MSCREDILLTDDANELDYWLSRFVLETWKEDGSPCSSRSIKLILSGLQSKKPITIQKSFKRDYHRFRNFRATCDTVFKKLLADGVGALVKHHTALTPKEDKLCEAGIFRTTHPQALQNAFFFM